MSIVGYSRLNQQYRTGIYRVAVALVGALAAQPGVTVVAYSATGNTFLARKVLRDEGLGEVPCFGSPFWGVVSFGLLVARNVTHRLGLRPIARFLTRLVEWSQTRRIHRDLGGLKTGDWYLSPMESPPEALRLLTGLKVALVVHDLIPLVLPDYRQDKDDPTRWFPRFVRSIRSTDLLFAVSDFTRRDFLRLFPAFPPDRVVVAHNAYDPSRFVEAAPTNGPQPFLTLSTVEPRKRMDTIVRAYHLYREAGGTRPLVIVGANRQGHQEHVLAHLSPDDRKGVTFTGYLPDEDLPGLYGNCAAFLYLSEYEGFGLPVLEAMACGAPVVVSDRTSLPEVAGEAGVIVSSEDPVPLAEVLARLDHDTVWTTSLRQASLTRATHFSWDKTAQIIVKSLEEKR